MSEPTANTAQLVEVTADDLPLHVAFRCHVLCRACEFADLFGARQRLAVDLGVRGERETLDRHEMRRHHELR